jgi:hypothetical protein
VNQKNGRGLLAPIKGTDTLAEANYEELASEEEIYLEEAEEKLHADLLSLVPDLYTPTHRKPFAQE